MLFAAWQPVVFDELQDVAKQKWQNDIIITPYTPDSWCVTMIVTSESGRHSSAFHKTGLANVSDLPEPVFPKAACQSIRQIMTECTAHTNDP